MGWALKGPGRPVGAAQALNAWALAHCPLLLGLEGQERTEGQEETAAVPFQKKIETTSSSRAAAIKADIRALEVVSLLLVRPAVSSPSFFIFPVVPHGLKAQENEAPEGKTVRRKEPACGYDVVVFLSEEERKDDNIAAGWEGHQGPQET